MRYRILPYRQGSRSAKSLADALGGRVLRLQGSSFQARTDDLIVNWGNTTSVAENAPYGLLNRNLRHVTNKLLFFRLMAENAPGVTPAFWETRDAIPEGAYPVVCRTVLSGHSGDGIVIAADPAGCVDCSLYVKYEKKRDEYRIHLGRPTSAAPEVISVQRKARRLDSENTNWQVRNHQNGFIYSRQDVNPPDVVMTAAIDAFVATDIDFGAVDVIYNANNNRAFALEINTAPGLEGQTVTDYANYFRSLT